MKKVIFTFALAISVIMAGWEPPVLVNDDGINIPLGGWSIFVADNGDIHFVWMNTSTHDLNFKTRQSSGTFTLAESLGGPLIPDFEGTMLAGNPDAMATIFTVDTGGAPGITYRERTGGSWQPPVLFDAEIPAYASGLCSFSNEFHIAFPKLVSSPNGTQIMYRKKIGNSWNDFETVALNDGDGHYRENPAVAVDNNGNPHVVWIRDWDNSLGYSKKEGTSWSGEVSIAGSVNTSDYELSFPHIICDGNGVLHVVYVTSHNPSQVYYIKSDDNGENWSTPLNISSATHDCYAPTIAVDNDQPSSSANIWVFWHEDITADSSVIFYRIWKAADSSWTDAPVELDHPGESSFYPSVFAGTDGVYLMWTERSTGGDTGVFYSKYTSPDVEMDSIVVPVGNIPDTVTTPEGIVKNNTDERVTVYARCWITGPDTNYEEDNVEGSVDIDPSASVHVTFPDWTPGEPGDSYEVRMKVYLDMSGEIELNTDNNELTDSCTVAYTHDVQAEEIIAPAEDTVNLGDTVDITASFSNYGLADEINVPCSYYVYKDGNPVTFSNSSIDTLGVEEVDTVNFSPWVPSEVGTYNIYVISALTTDENPENDTLIDTVVVTNQGVNSIIDKEEVIWDPVNKVVKVRGMEGAILKMYNVAGINVKKVDIDSNEKNIELKNFPNGIYFIDLSTNNVHRGMIRIIVF